MFLLFHRYSDNAAYPYNTRTHQSNDKTKLKDCSLAYVSGFLYFIYLFMFFFFLHGEVCALKPRNLCLSWCTDKSFYPTSKFQNRLSKWKVRPSTDSIHVSSELSCRYARKLSKGNYSG